MTSQFLTFLTVFVWSSLISLLILGYSGTKLDFIQVFDILDNETVWLKQVVSNLELVSEYGKFSPVVVVVVVVESNEEGISSSRTKIHNSFRFLHLLTFIKILSSVIRYFRECLTI